jgi:D-tyrosyl-tRNA(Tyr) deacylase
MRVVLQRVKKANVKVDNKTTLQQAQDTVSEIADGFLLLLGITHADTKKDADYLVDKIAKMRIFEDENKKMNKSLEEVGGSVLVVSQFTLYADCKKGNRPSFTNAAKPDEAEKLYEYFIELFKERKIDTKTGEFGAYMNVELVNDGPVTIVLDTARK